MGQAIIAGMVITVCAKASFSRDQNCRSTTTVENLGQNV